MRFKKYTCMIYYQYEIINKVISIINYKMHNLCKLCKSLKVYMPKQITSFIHLKSNTVYEIKIMLF